MTEITDIYGRAFKTLRVSLTNTCNLGCVYCVDESDQNRFQKQDILSSNELITQKALSVDEFIEVIRSLHEVLNLETVRLTGGEPTLYRDLVPLMKGIQGIGISAIKMTTNGYLLSHKIEQYAEAGLTSLNISLDAIEPEPFFQMSRRRNIQKVLDGIVRAVELGLEVKINCVVMKGLNENQIIPLLNFAQRYNIRIRFLELMQMGHLYGNFEEYFFSEQAILDVISVHTPFVALPRDPSATAKYWELADGYQFGIISNESDPFCNDCNRLRVDSYGNIYGCLSDNTSVPVYEHLNEPDIMEEKLRQALSQKKKKFSGSTLSMLAIGG
ncbi:radical SAM protein [Cytophagaceae bacterium YF14B1]|uniref:Radical SAM protein n=1 Tax=Xanthocytophaga flava TaxID=3048013 RepID=A0AAE3QKA0_9BACT|nr:radical SAM protein [Xanthocytophaga flavus]MDJ1480171.1 radical SAM protein [Xanthocytophaga flavus]